LIDVNAVLRFALSRKQRPELWWSQGCSKAIQMLLIQKLHVVGIVAIVIAFFQVSSCSWLRDEMC